MDLFGNGLSSCMFLRFICKSNARTVVSCSFIYVVKANYQNMTTPKEYEDRIGGLLSMFFTNMDDAAIRVRKSLKYRSERGYRSYSPNIDISVGPFSERRGVSLWNRYDDLVRFSSDFIDEMLIQFCSNYEDFGEGFFRIDERTIPGSYANFLSTSKGANWNARCLMAIEVEASGNRKHLLGDLINVSVSGRIGIVVGYNRDKLKTFLRQLDYLAYTIEAKKIRFNSGNIIVLKPDQFEKILLDNLKET